MKDATPEFRMVLSKDTITMEGENPVTRVGRAGRKDENPGIRVREAGMRGKDLSTSGFDDPDSIRVN